MLSPVRPSPRGHRLATAALALGALLCAPAAALAQTDPEKTPLDLRDVEPAQAAPDTGGSLTRTLVGLAVVVAVIYAVYWLLRQVKASREESASGFGLHSLATLPLGGGRSLHMVRSGREVVLVGVSEHGVTPIRSWSEDEAVASGLTGDDDDLAPFAPEQPPRARAWGPADVLESLRRRTVRR